MSYFTQRHRYRLHSIFCFYSLSIVFFNNFYWGIVDFPCCVFHVYIKVNLLYILHISTLFQILFPYRSLQTYGKSFLEFPVSTTFLRSMQDGLSTTNPLLLVLSFLPGGLLGKWSSKFKDFTSVKFLPRVDIYLKGQALPSPRKIKTKNTHSPEHLWNATVSNTAQC